MTLQTLFTRLRSWWLGLTSRSAVERDMDEELRFHIDTYAADLIRDGVPREEAKRRALAEFGGLELRKDECREARGLRIADEVRADVRYTLRQLRRSPVFTAVAILSLGLGIGANTAIFSMMEQALWKAMPVRNAEQLRVFIWSSSGDRTVMGSEWGNWSRPYHGNGSTTSEAFSYDAFQAFRQRTTTFAEVFAFKRIGRATAVIDGQAELISPVLVSGSFYDGLQLVPVVGRPIDARDDRIGASEIVGVISDGFWSRRFGRDPAIVGRSISVNEVPVTIVGVNPPAFTGVESGTHPDIFLPLTSQPRVLPWRYGTNPSLVANPDYWWLGVMGRLKPGVTDAQAQAETDAVLQQVAMALRDTKPPNKDVSMPHLSLLTGSRGLDNLREQFAEPLLLLFALVAVVLLTACANVANLLLARATTRSRELSLRLALGASRARLARQLLTEGLTLGIGGGLLGLLIGYWSRDAIPNLMVPAWSANRLATAFDTRVLLLATLVTIATSVLFSLAPIWQSMRVEIGTALKHAGRITTSGSGGHSLAPLRGRALIVFQVGLSMLLLIAAGLFARTLSNIKAIDLGFKPERILLFTIDPPRNRYSGAARSALFDRIREQLVDIPGVEEATLSADVLVGAGRSRTGVIIEGQTTNAATSSWVNIVGHRFTETMGIPIVAGRSFDDHDRAGSLPVAIVNERWVREYFPNNPNPIGHTFRNNDTVLQIVGICGDTHFDKVRNEVPPTFYRLFVQTEVGAMTFALRTSVSTGAIMTSARQAVARIDKDLPVFDVRTQIQQIESTETSERLFATLTITLGLLALILASIGIYGLMAQNVSRRTSEIGIRMALGAHRTDVLLMILREASWLAIAGVIVGIAAASWLGRYIESMLYGVHPADPVTIIGAIVVMLLVAILASGLPARRAAHLDPMSALRHD
jgi:predicted permease